MRAGRAGRGKDKEQLFSVAWLVHEKGHSAQENRCGPHPSGVLSINKEQSRLPESLGLRFFFFFFITYFLSVVCSEPNATDS